MSSSAFLRSGRLNIKDGRGPRESGLFFGRNGFAGWDSGAIMRTPTTKRPNQHGDFDTNGTLSGRLWPLRGVCFYKTPYEFNRFRDMVIGHGVAGGRFAVTVTRNGRSLRAMARLANGQQSTFEEVGTKGYAEWSMDWWFPDPLKYGELFEITPGSSVTVENEGNFPATAKYRITGSAPGGYTITGPNDEQVVINRPLSAGAPHLFDMARMQLYVDGTPVDDGVTRSEVFLLRPGVSKVSVSNGLSLDVEGRHTFL